MLFYDPSDFLPVQSVEQLTKLTSLRESENLGKHLLVQGNLYNRPVGKDGKQRDKVKAGSSSINPLTEAVNPSPAPLFITRSDQEVTLDAIK